MSVLAAVRQAVRNSLDRQLQTSLGGELCAAPLARDSRQLDRRRPGSPGSHAPRPRLAYAPVGPRKFILDELGQAPSNFQGACYMLGSICTRILGFEIEPLTLNFCESIS